MEYKNSDFLVPRSLVDRELIAIHIALGSNISIFPIQVFGVR